MSLQRAEKGVDTVTNTTWMVDLKKKKWGLRRGGLVLALAPRMAVITEDVS